MKNYIKKYAPCFDSRIIEFLPEKLFEISNNLIWRSLYDCKRNSISSYGRYILGKKEIKNKNGNEMINLMKEKGFDFNLLELYKIYGVYSKKKIILLKNEYGDFQRNIIFNFEVIMNSSIEMNSFLLNPKSLTLDELENLKINLKFNEISF